MKYETEDIMLAPLAGYTDMPFRHSCRRYGLKYAYTALIDAGALIYGNDENSCILMRGEDEPWLGVQLLGSRIDFLEKAAPMINEMNYDEANFNMGCPVKKVVQRNSGAGLLGDLTLAEACVRVMREKITRMPLTVKLRILSETDIEATVSWCKKLESLGVEGIVIHGRLASKMYSGPVFGGIISAVREAVSIPVCANGGIFSVSTADALRDETGCRRLMIARGAIGNPWIVKSLLEGQDYCPAHEELCDEMETHVREMMAVYGELGGMVRARKIILAYLSGKGYPRTLKSGVCTMKNDAEFTAFMNELRRNGGQPRE